MQYTSIRQIVPIIIIGLLLIGVNAHAETAYYNKSGKRVSKGQAIVAGLKVPGSRFMKIQTSYVVVNPAKASLKKISDVSIAQACEGRK